MDEQKNYGNLSKLDKVREIERIFDSRTDWEADQLFIGSDGRAILDGIFSAEQLLLIVQYIQYKKENPTQ